MLLLALPSTVLAAPGPHAAQQALADRGLLRVPRAAAPPPSDTPPDRVVYGYLPYWTVAVDDVPWDHLTHLAIFSVGVGSDGSLSSLSHWTDRAADAVALGHAHGVKIDLCVTQFDADTIGAIVGSSSARAAAIDAIAAQVDAYGADGVNVDFEGLPAAHRADMVTFVTELRARVGEVFLATPAVDWSDAWDYSALSDASDGLFIMGYGYHWTGGGAGPNAPLEAGDLWSQWTLSWSVSDYLAAGADPDKVILGLPTYGQEWPVADSSQVPATSTDDGWSVFYTDAEAAAATYGRSYDAASDTPWYASSGTLQCWYDDADSLDVKMDWAVNSAGIAGFGFWAIGYDGNDPALWAAVDAASHVDDPGGTGDTTDDTGGTADDTDPESGGRPGQARVIEGEDAGLCATGEGSAAAALVAIAGLLAGKRRR